MFDLLLASVDEFEDVLAHYFPLLHVWIPLETSSHLSVETLCCVYSVGAMEACPCDELVDAPWFPKGDHDG
jgi:hypothetical protein